MSGPIVVLFDGSSAAERALYAATDIARRFHAAIHLVGIQAGIETQLELLHGSHSLPNTTGVLCVYMAMGLQGAPLGATIAHRG